MQTKGKVFEDIAELMTNAMGVAQDAKKEFETGLRSIFDRWLAQSNLVTREEFEIVQTMAEKALRENEALRKRIRKIENATKKP